MQKPTPGPVWQILGWVLVPLYYPEYRKLLIRSYVLAARLELLCAFFTVTAPFATPGLLRLIRRWMNRLREDVAEFGRLVRMPRVRPTPQVGDDSRYQNPWT